MILGINEGIDASVVACDGGRIVFAVQEERLNREKGFVGFPKRALELCIESLGLDRGNVERICFSNISSPFGESRRDIRKYYVKNAVPFSTLVRSGNLEGVTRRIANRLPEPVRAVIAKGRWRWRGVSNNRRIEGEMAAVGLESVPVVRYHHHLNHAAAAYYGMRRNDHDAHLVLTLDGGGDDACAHVYLAQGSHFELLASTPTGHSLGNIYACATFMMGMQPHEHEFKLMGLAPYPGKKYAQPISEKLSKYLDLDPQDGLRFRRRITEPTNQIVPRMQRDLIYERFDNIAAGLQQFTEDLLIKWVNTCIAKTGIRNVVAAGGVFMNVKANKLIAELPEVEFFDVFPSCGDETLPFGAVWKCYADITGRHEDITFDDIYLGPEASADIEIAKTKFDGLVKFEPVVDAEAVAAQLLANGEVVGRCSGRMEFGARALGNRSLLADPRRVGVVDEINRMVKQRDFWMPFAPAIMAERATDYVRVPRTLPQSRVSPFMMHTFDTTENRDALIAGIHRADGTARAQIVSKRQNPSFHRLIDHFGQLTGNPVVLNTSFNLHGYPIVCGTCDALEVMLNSSVRYIIADNYLISKKE